MKSILDVDTNYRKDVRNLRNKIDQLDRCVIESIGDRMRICWRIGLIKKMNGWPVKDNGRENKIIKDRVKFATQNGLSENFAVGLMELIMEESKKLQNQIGI